ncbi:DgyrCDS2632 [Dimorphilus gyrociliatus]|uniref:NAD-dependent protein deacylase n=1 Tax=Dimorphilus gyrociliatus TaxID=2664684 RepID=A0A7I8VDX9_9ANNE|nr:DgyrCDS2632 [Dimorphilus gyrociliatus]
MAPSSDLAKFRHLFAEAKNILILTGAGVSAESGVPTFRGAGGLWRTFAAQSVATPEAFSRDPSLVWEFYHYRREVMRTKDPNPAHKAIAECEERLGKQTRKVTVVTQNIDELHKRAGSKNIIELHGSLFKVKCLTCDEVTANYDSPICHSLAGKGSPDKNAIDAKIPEKDLPRCKPCGGLLRPHVVWFGEQLDKDVLEKTYEVGTSSVVYPAAMFAPELAKKGVPVAEFNLEKTPVTSDFRFHFQGPSGEWLPKALAPLE